MWQQPSPSPTRGRVRPRQYAVTKASQIGNSFSQFRSNDHRGNVNVTDRTGGCGYSLHVCCPEGDRGGELGVGGCRLRQMMCDDASE